MSLCAEQSSRVGESESGEGGKGGGEETWRVSLCSWEVVMVVVVKVQWARKGMLLVFGRWLAHWLAT